jgi:hypothetical protein
LSELNNEKRFRQTLHLCQPLPVGPGNLDSAGNFGSWKMPGFRRSIVKADEATRTPSIAGRNEGALGPAGATV